jgi:hypothetical protein
MLEVCNQMKVMGFNVYSQIMIGADPNQTTNLKRNPNQLNKRVSLI